MRALVTGGAGFIGSNLVEALVNKSWDVTVIDSLLTGNKKNLALVKHKITFSQSSVNDKEQLEKAMQGADIVFHLAALPSVPKSIADPSTSHINNIDATFTVLLTAKELGIKKVIYSASSSAYGDAQEAIKTEDLPAKPISPYGLMKYTGEEYCRIFSLVYGLKTVSLRYFNIFGPKQNPSSAYAAVIPKFITNALDNKPLVIHGDGEIRRDFTYVQNAVDANITAAISDKAAGTYNIACGASFSLNELASKIQELSGKELEVIHGPERPGDIKKSLASIEKAKNDFGYCPKINFEEGLKRSFEWYKNNREYFKKTGE